MGRREGCITAVNKSDCGRFFACLISSKFGIYQPSRQHCPFSLLPVLTFHSSVLLPSYCNCLQQFRGFVEMPSTLLDSGLMHFSGLFTCVLSEQFPIPIPDVSCLLSSKGVCIPFSSYGLSGSRRGGHVSRCLL